MIHPDTNMKVYSCGGITFPSAMLEALWFFLCIGRAEDVGSDGSGLSLPLCVWAAVEPPAERRTAAHLQRPRLARTARETGPQRTPGYRWQCGYPRKRWQRWQEGGKGREGRRRYIINKSTKNTVNVWPANELYCTAEDQSSFLREEEMKWCNNVTKYWTDLRFYSAMVIKLKLLLRVSSGGSRKRAHQILVSQCLINIF